MSVQQIWEDLSAALREGSIALRWATVPGLDGVLSAIGVAETQDLSLTGATLTRGAAAAILAGIAGWRDFTWATTLTGEEEASGANRFTLVMRGQDAQQPWRFSTSFATLPGTRRAAANGALVIGPSVLASLVVQQPRVSVTAGALTGGASAAVDAPPRPTMPVVLARDPADTELTSPRLEGWLVLGGSELAGYVPYLGAARLRLDGSIDLTAAVPVLELRAVASAAQLPLGTEPASVLGVRSSEVGLRLESAYPDIYSLEEDATMSTAAIYAKIQVGTRAPLYTEVSAPLFQDDALWPLCVAFENPVTILDAMALVLELFGQSDPSLFSFPLSRGVLSKFGLSGVELGIRPPLEGQTPGLSYAAVQFRSNEAWDPPVPFVTLRELGTGWVFHWYAGTTFASGNVWGKLTLFGGIELLATATIPDFDLVARTEEPIAVPLAELLQTYLGGSAGLSDELQITEALVEASPTRQTYHGSLLVEGVMKVEVGAVTFGLDKILGEIRATQSRISGSISGFVSIQVPAGDAPAGSPERALELADGTLDTKAVFLVEAAYEGAGEGSWSFAGGLADGTLSLLDFAWGLFGARPSPTLPEVQLTELWLTYATSEGKPYSARGALAVRWEPREPLGLKLSLSARARYARRPQESASDRALARIAPYRADIEETMIAEGELYGTFTVNRLSVTVGLSFVDKETVYLFEVAWGSVSLRAITMNVADAEGEGTHKALAINLRGLTLGGLVERLLALANPNLNYHLEAPWSVLDSIDLSRFTLTIDPTLQTVAVTYDVGLELGFMSVVTVGLLYDRSAGEGSVRFVLTGRFLGQGYDSRKPLSWDAAKDAPPEIPGKGASLFELRYLGMGQHVTLSGLTQYESVGAVLEALSEEMQPLTENDVNPLTQSSLRFDESSEWMLGLDCTAMDTVTLGLVMHDPDLYGVLVSLAGPESGSLAGLSFEMLYKRVTDTIGVFRVRLQVPDAFRQIMLGPVSVTLGVVTVEVFTNGDFLADLGFPHNRDFSASFGLQAGPFIGSGGIYFGLLDGATSKRVPAVVNGTFDPVLELGIGISAGVGRTFEKGPLSAGLYVQMLAIIEGVLGWFAPTDSAAPRAMYYWGQGSVGIVGKLYGSVDFKVIRASVSVEAHAIVTVTFAAYEQTVVELDVGVEVSAEVEILFISVSFHFKLQLTASFTIGERSTPPWTLAPGQADRGQRRMLANVAPAPRLGAAAMRALTRETFLRERGHDLRAGEQPPYELVWRTDIHVFPDGAAHPIDVKLLPAFTLDAVPVTWPGQSPSGESDAFRIAFLTTIDNGVPPGADSIERARRLTAEHSASARTAAETSFSVTVEAMLRWALSALGLDPVAGVVTAGQLQELARQLDMAQTTETGFAMSTLSAFFVPNLEMRVSAIPSGEPARAGGTAFPIPPPLGWDSGAEPDPLQRRFAEYCPVDATYQREVAAYFAPLDPNPSSGSEAGEHGAEGSTSDTGGETEEEAAESMASFVFRDWFLLVTKAAVQAAIELLAAFPYPLTGDSTEALASICAKFPAVAVTYEKHLGDTVEQVAQAFGLSAAELLALNPQIATTLQDAAVGGSMEVKIGATPEGVAAANPDWPLKAGVRLALGQLVHQVGEADTLEAIAANLGAPLAPWLQSDALLDAPRLLRADAPLTIPAASFANATGIELLIAAALVYVRLRGTDDLHVADADADGVPLVQWYATAISTLNAIPPAGALPATLQVPKGYDQLEEPLTWTTLEGDTLWDVAATFALAQHPEADAGFAAWLLEVRALNPGSGPFARVLLPATATAVQGNETLRALAARLPLELPDPEHAGQYLSREASFEKLVAAATLLAPLQPLDVPGCVGLTEAGQTISGFAQRYDLSPQELGRRAATQADLLTPSSERELKVPHPGSAPIGAASEDPQPQELVPAVLRAHGGTISGQASRFLLHGLRVGAPQLGEDGAYHPTGPMSGIFELTGQQLPGPAPSAAGQPAGEPAPSPAGEPAPSPTAGGEGSSAGDSAEDPSEDRLTLTVKVFEAARWCKLYESVALSGDEPIEALLAVNPGLARRERHAGIVALTGEVEELVLHITETDLENYPARKLTPVFSAPPAALALARRTTVRHGLQQRVLWQTTETIALPNPGGAVVPAIGALTMWPFTSDLRAAAARFPDLAFALLRTDPALGPNAEPSALSRFAWASSVQLAVRRIAGQPNTYELLGADAAGRDTLLSLWSYLAEHGEGADSAQLHLLTQPPASTGLPQGLASTVLDEDRTFVVKTNLSTETVSPDALAQVRGPVPTFGEYYARIADATRFLTLLWEGSVVGGSGYWLRCTAADGSGLPESAFAADGTARLTLIALLASQTEEPPSRVLRPFENCAIVGETIDASSASLFAEVQGEAETQLQATVSPGNVAFGMALERPPATPPGSAPEPQPALRRLYSLAGYSLRATASFKGSGQGMPVGPQVPQISSRGVQRGEETTWDIFQVVPAHRFALHPRLRDVEGLPAAAEDPYAGIERVGEGPGVAEALVCFREVLGNASLESGEPASGGPATVSMPVGYTDPLLGIASWPATASSFRVLPATSGTEGAKLLVVLALQASAHLAGPLERGSAGAAIAKRQLARFSEVYYQVTQPDVSAALLSTLEQEADKPPVSHPVSAGALADFATAACAWLTSAAALRDAAVDAAASGTLAGACTRYGVGWEELAAANLEVALNEIFAAEASIPSYVPFRDGATVAALCPDGSDPAALLAEEENATLLLRPGVELVVPVHTITVPPDPVPPAAPATLAALARGNGVSIASLLRLNLATAGLLRQGTVFTCQGVTVEVSAAHPEVSLQDVASTFAEHGVPYDAVMVAGANSELPGVLRAGAQLQLDRTLIRAGETLSENHTDVPLAELAEENVAVVDLLPAGAPLLVGKRPAEAAMQRPLGAAAELWGVPAAQLLRHNAAAALAAETELAVPGQAALPEEPGLLRVPYRLPAQATLSGTAKLFLATEAHAGVAAQTSSAALALASANLNLAGTIAGGQTIELDEQHVQTQDGDALADVLARFDPPIQLSALVEAIAERTGLLAEGALMLCPPAALGSEAPSTLRAAGERYGLDATAIAIANASLAGVVAAGAEVSLTAADGTVVKVQAGAADSLNSLAWHFAQVGLATTVAAIASANETTPLLRAGATLLLAPPPCEVSASLGAAGWSFPTTVFPLRAWLELARDPLLVDPAFRGEDPSAAEAGPRDASDDPGEAKTAVEADPGPVARDRAALAPSVALGEDETLALEGFARELQGAIPSLRVASGKVAGAERTDVWAVAFDETHIEKIAIAPGAQVPDKGKIPQFFALAPLQNSLVSRTEVPISPLNEDGTLGPSAPADFQGVDLESWARRLLADVDLFVSAPYATAAYASGQRASLEAVLATKGALADAIVLGLDYVLELGQPEQPARQHPQPPDWIAAGETLRQRLLVGLAAGYGSAAVVQYDTEVTSPWTGDQARLAGTGQLAGETAGEQRRVRVSGAKTSLQAGDSYVNFVVDVAEEGRERSVELDLSYAVGELEFDVAEVVSGYDSSDWLSFATPFSASLPAGVAFELGTPQVPLPLRAYPPLPALLGQTATASSPEAETYEQALHWDYSVDFQHQSMASDQLKLEVELNRQPRTAALGEEDEDLFTALARYVAVAPALWEIVGSLPTASEPIDPKLEHAIATFSALVAAVAGAWKNHWNPAPKSNPDPAHEPIPATGVPAASTHTFTVTLTPRFDAEAGKWYWSELLLERDDDTLQWPRIGCFTPGGDVQEMGTGQEAPAGRTYAFPASIEAFGLLGYQLSFGELHVATHQNALARIQVVRNAHLLDEGPATRASFVYQSPVLAFPSATTPLLSWYQPFAIGDWVAEATGNPLAPVFTALFDGEESERTIACAISYGYELGGSSADPLVSELPVAYRPCFSFGADTVAQIVETVQDWQRAQQPSSAGGEWIFGLSLYSSVEGELGRPLLELRRLRSRIAT